MARSAEGPDGSGAPPAQADAPETAVTPEAAEPTEDSEDSATSADQERDQASEPSDSTPAPRKPRRLPVLIAVAAFALAIDVISKILVVQHLSDRGPIHLPGGFLNLVLIRNSGAAFSIGEGQTWVFTIIAAAVVFVILRVSRNLRSLPWACALGLLLGGALGNLSDRIFREPGLFRGHVVDFLQFPTFPVVHYDFPVFNLADSAIVVGGCLMVLLSFLGMQPDGTRHGDGDGTKPESEAKSEPEDSDPAE
ncbi:signal peptidase II [Catenulispora subtropica]|uniref:Lipoprotein signal peptidase n=1 Tax=Catenulispora subtropica TaxID=450798 RepID=A0ABN2S4T4_9ACTN